MPLTCPLRTVPAIYEAQTRLALPTLIDQWRRPHPAAPFAYQLIWHWPSGGLGRGLTATLLAGRSRLRTTCAEILARDGTLQAVLEKHLDRMCAKLQTPFAAHAVYYPNAVGLIATDTERNVDAWHRGTIGRGVRLICESIGTQAEAIARHDDHVVMTRNFGEAVGRYDAELAAELRFPGVGALLSRECRPGPSAKRASATSCSLPDPALGAAADRTERPARRSHVAVRTDPPQLLRSARTDCRTRS